MALTLVFRKCVSECTQSCALYLLGYASETALMQVIATTDIEVLGNFVEQHFCGHPKVMQTLFHHNIYCQMFDIVTRLPTAGQEWLGGSTTQQEQPAAQPSFNS